MATRTVTFKREWAGMDVDLWVKHPNQVTEKLIFTNGFASSSLDETQDYVIFWLASGTEGTELKVGRQVEGVDADFVELLKWTMPRKDGAAFGEILTYQGHRNFKLQGA